MPSLVARTATQALASATLPYVERLSRGVLHALAEDRGLAQAVLVADGVITNIDLRAA